MSEQVTMLGPGQYALTHVDLPYTEDQIKVVMREHGSHVVKHGAGPGSLESDDTAGLDYIVMTSSGIKQHLPKLWELYADPARVAEVSSLAGEPVEIQDNEGGINLNYVLSGGRYELHFDRLPYTMLAFVSTLAEGDGGQLAVYRDKDDPKPAAAFLPVAGQAVVFDGSVSAHGVQPCRVERISMPMVYPATRLGASADAGQYAYLYGDDE